MDPNRVFFPLARRFVAGRSIAEALTVVERLNAGGMLATLDVLGEDSTDQGEAETTVDTYLALAEALTERRLQANLSVKLSALGLHHDPASVKDRLAHIIRASSTLSDPFVRVDMERADSIDATLNIVEQLFTATHRVGPVLQAALRRTPEDLERMIANGIRVRLCKGAYRNPTTIAYQRQEEIRAAYLRLAERLLRAGHLPGIATHDPTLIEAICDLTQREGISRDRFEFQMLYGVRPELQRRLVAAKYRVRIYVPFGTRWFAYLRRRIMERRENALFAIGAIFLR